MSKKTTRTQLPANIEIPSVNGDSQDEVNVSPTKNIDKEKMQKDIDNSSYQVIGTPSDVNNPPSYEDLRPQVQRLTCELDRKNLILAAFKRRFNRQTVPRIVSADELVIRHLTPFPSKAAASAFYMTFVKPILPHLEGMTAYLKRCLDGRKECLRADLKRYCGEDNVPANPDKILLRKMRRAKNARLFSESKFKKDPHQLRSASVVVEDEIDDHVDHWYDDAVPKTPPSNQYLYRGHGGLNLEQEWLLFLTKIHHNVPNSFLAERWLNCMDELTCRIVRYVINLWTAAMYYILRAEKFWCDPDVMEEVNIKLGRDDGDINPDYIADCSCTPLQGQTCHDICRIILSITHHHVSKHKVIPEVTRGGVWKQVTDCGGIIITHMGGNIV